MPASSPTAGWWRGSARCRDEDANVVNANLAAADCFTSPRINRARHARARRLTDGHRAAEPDLRRKLALAGEVSGAEKDIRPSNNTDQAAVNVAVAAVELTATARPRRSPPVQRRRSRSRCSRAADAERDVNVCVRVPTGLTILRRGGAALRGTSLCWRIRRLANGRHRTRRLRARPLCVSRARSINLKITVNGAGVHTRGGVVGQARSESHAR
jgi:hypothetical protein